MIFSTKQLYTCGLLLAATTAGSASAAVVLSDNFDEPNGTAVDGKSADVAGSTWEEFVNQDNYTIENGSLSTVGAGRETIINFTDTLGAGQLLTFTFQSAEGTKMVAGSAYNGLNLLAGANAYEFERGPARGQTPFYFGNPGASTDVGTWWIEGEATIDTGVTDTIAGGTFTYAFDTGDWTFNLLGAEGGAYSQSGTATAGIEFNGMRVINARGGDFAVSSVNVDFTTVPEPAALTSLAALGLLLRRRRSI